ncbi:hypothetical protein KFK09_024215 [Dendrobium nobile]|uniref:Uncharacterized protein n=1 Tax=Dendrobium nobile TaxID=94219 RepID=A0A8T3ADH3_DENNO|nr:hypothetical protein KFK09_024215 [Dendrobium nobile]
MKELKGPGSLPSSRTPNRDPVPSPCSSQRSRALGPVSLSHPLSIFPARRRQNGWSPTRSPRLSPSRALWFAEEKEPEPEPSSLSVALGRHQHEEPKPLSLSRLSYSQSPSRRPHCRRPNPWPCPTPALGFISLVPSLIAKHILVRRSFKKVRFSADTWRV